MSFRNHHHPARRPATRFSSCVLYAVVLAVTAVCSLQAQAQAQVIEVGTEPQLRNALAAANSAGGGRTILLADGTYTLSDTLYVNSPGITIAGKSSDRTKVVIQGDAMSAAARVGNLIRVAASNFTLSDVTLQKSGWHLVQVVGEANADSPVIRNCIMRDAFEQMVKVSVSTDSPGTTSDYGIVENCLFEYTAGIGPQFYIGGIDAHGAKNWVVRDNTFRSIISPSGSVAEFAVHFWNGSANNLVERNLIVNCDRGIGFGLDGRGNVGGVIRNNMIHHSAGNGAFADVAISLVESPDSKVYNNTVFLENDFPWSIEYRFSGTRNVHIANNLVNRPIVSRDGATGVIASNVVSAVRQWFVDAASGNLRLASPVSSVVDNGASIDGLVDDIDRQGRPWGSGVDIGASEWRVGAVPNPPTNLLIQ